MNKAPINTLQIKMEIKDDILHFTYHSGSIITIDTAKEIVKQRIDYCNRISYPLLVKFEGLRAMDKQSRDYFAKEGVEGVLAAALLTNSVYTEFFGNMFLRITKTSISSRLFTDSEVALKWLEQFKPKP